MTQIVNYFADLQKHLNKPNATVTVSKEKHHPIAGFVTFKYETQTQAYNTTVYAQQVLATDPITQPQITAFITNKQNPENNMVLGTKEAKDIHDMLVCHKFYSQQKSN